MGLFRNRQDDEDATAPPGVYRMRERVMAIGDDFWIENGAGQRAYKVDGKALRLRKTLVLEDASGRELYKIQEKMLHIRDTMEIENASTRVATVKKALISPLRERYNVEFDGGGEWRAQGNIVDHQYTIASDAGQIAEVGKKWFRVRDTYGVELKPGQDEGVLLAAVVALEALTDGR